MHTSKPRRNKRRQARAVHVPMMPDTHRKLALEMHLAAEALITQPSPATYNQLTKILAALNRAGHASASLDLANTAMAAICDRYERMGKVGVSENEALVLKLAIGGLDQKLSSIPLNKIKQAVAEVYLFYKTVGA